MRVDIPTFFAVLTMLIGTPAAFAEMSSVDDLLELTNPSLALDNLKLSERQSLVAKLVNALPKAKHDRKLAIANVLCRSSGWTSADDDAEAQERIWAEMAKVTDPQDRLMYALDCAAANREGFFRARTLTPLFNMRLSFCSEQPFGNDTMAELNVIQRQMENFSKSIEDGLAQTLQKSDEGQTVTSFFPMRTALRLATVRAAKAVHLANENKWRLAQREFRRTAKYLRNKVPQDYGSPWGAWRYHNDFEFYIEFYSWLGGNRKNDFKKFEKWPTLVDDGEIKSSIPADVHTQIKAQLKEQRTNGHKAEPYVDWLYVERLLPGAATGENECDRWRRRYYNPRVLATHIAECTDGKPPKGTAELKEFDACVHRLEASDWRVQYMITRKSSEKHARNVIKKFVEALLNQDPFSDLKLSKEQEGEAKRILNSFKPYTVEGRNDLVRMLSDQGLTTGMRDALEEVIESGTVQLPWNTRPLFRRPEHF